MGEAIERGCVFVHSDAIRTLVELRWSKGLGLDSCAERLGIDSRDLYAKERGRIAFTAGEFAALAAALEVDQQELAQILMLSGAAGSQPRR